jgi:hypothetical protein
MNKGDLISEGILNLVPLPTKGAKSLPWAENLNFPPITVNNLFKFSAQCQITPWYISGSDLARFIANGTKVKIPSEIKIPLIKYWTKCGYKFITY